VDYAIEEARNTNCKFVGIVHLLIGLMREKEGVAGEILAKQGMTVERLRNNFLISLSKPTREWSVNLCDDPTNRNEETND